MKKYYITTTLPYVNADPHIGFAMEIVTADALARYQRMLGKEVIFNTGTDEHGLKIYQKAIKLKKSVQEYTDEYAAKFGALRELLDLSYTNFVRTTDSHHMLAAQEFWLRCQKNGDIYKKKYRVKYCVGCELEKTESELVEGRCPLHPNAELETIEEENYFFRFSKYQQTLLSLYTNQTDFVRPDEKMKEIYSFVNHGLQDFSISRLKAKLPWGIEVPGDPEQVMYVWFDALINYVSTIGWPDRLDEFDSAWPVVQIAGKDNLRQQAAMWQAMLMSAGIQPSAKILINGFISVDGQKMSKSLGNVISPIEMVKRYGVSGTRYLLLFFGPVTGDIDVTWEKYDEVYNGQLANSLGNTVQRIATLATRSTFNFNPVLPQSIRPDVTNYLDKYRFDLALNEVLAPIKTMEKRIDERKPWTLSGNELREFLTESVNILVQVGYELQPFMPEAATKIMSIFKGPEIIQPTPLFPRI